MSHAEAGTWRGVVGAGRTWGAEIVLRDALARTTETVNPRVRERSARFTSDRIRHLSDIVADDAEGARSSLHAHSALTFDS